MEIQRQWGIPVVTAEKVFPYLGNVGIKPWVRVGEPIKYADYVQKPLSEAERSELRFAPDVQVVDFEKPDGKFFRGFRATPKNWATTFCLFPDDLVPIVAEWKHGAEVLTLVPPSGVPGKADNGSMETCAKREFEEETGIKLERVECLGGAAGLPIASRGLTTRYFPFLGNPILPIQRGPSKLDENELLELVLLPLKEWLKLVNLGLTNEECAVSITYLALNRLGRLRVE